MSNPTRTLRRNITLTKNAPPSIVRAAKQRMGHQGPKQEKKSKTSGQREQNDNHTESFDVHGNKLEDGAQAIESPNFRTDVTSNYKDEDGLADDASGEQQLMYAQLKHLSLVKTVG